MTILSHVRKVSVVSVIEVRSLIGEGVGGDPLRELVEYFSLEGKPLAEFDQWKREQEIAAMLPEF